MKKSSMFGHVLLSSACLSGCVGFSTHSNHLVRISITELISATPAPNVSLSIAYDYDSYGWFHYLNTPVGEAAITNSQGTAEMNLADFRYRILLSVDGRLTSLNKQLVREGGVVSVPPYKVTLTPSR
jgi:hypothetical protein